MSSSMVCQGLQSCLDPPFVEPRLKIVATKSLLVNSITLRDTDHEDMKISMCNDNNEECEETKKDDMGGWSFIQKLDEQQQQQKPYVHPLSKLSSTSQLSNKSLELCTETLGSETGSDIGDDIDMSLSSSDSESSKSPTKHRSRLRDTTFRSCKKFNYGSLPPPLTSISGSNCYSIRPHREGGRLVLKAFLTPSSNTACFQAERRDGRLKLRYIRNFDSAYCSNSQEQEEKHVGDEEDYLEKEMEGNKTNVGGESGKIQRPSRCKEGGRGSNNNNKGLLMWETSWVAT